MYYHPFLYNLWSFVSHIIFFFLIVWIILYAFRHKRPGLWQRNSAEDILKRRFARGEISEEEFKKRLDVLKSSRE